MTSYTVIFTHPSGATATFIYENGEMSALAKGLDAEQFWVFKQVKSLLLRNEEDDLALAKAMMRQHGFEAQVMKPLPDLLASPSASIPGRPGVAEDVPYIHYRRLPHTMDSFAMFTRPGTSHGEVHWREHAVVEPKPPHKVGALPLPEAPQNAKTPVQPYVTPAHVATTHGEVHWREDQ